jgi:hypothetical protein
MKTKSIIVVPISPDPISGLARVAEHNGFFLERDGELVQQVNVVTLNADGEPILEHLEHLSESQRNVAASRYADTPYTRRTRDALVDKTGEPVAIDQATGEPPAGAISQMLFFNGITLGMLKKKGIPVNDNSSVVGLLCALIQQEMASLDKRGVY